MKEAMSVVFNPPPRWRTYLPSNFVPESDWTPPPTWDPLPSDWALWVDSDSGVPADTPKQYEANAALNIPKPLSAVSSTATDGSTITNSRGVPRNPFSNGQDNATMRPFDHEASKRSRSRSKIFYPLVSLTALAVTAIIIIFAFGSPEANPANNNAPSAAVGTNTQNKSETSLGYSNALRAANDYLSLMPLSSKGLKELLESSGYSNEEAQYALENITADWNEHAIKYANEALESMSLSRSGLGGVLESGGFTEQQANHALENITADWNEQARAAAREAIAQSPYSRKQLLEYLEANGFTPKQAEAGAQATGL